MRSRSFFEKKIRPIFVAQCNSCHSATAKKLRGKFSLDSRADLMRGGDDVPRVAATTVMADMLHEMTRKGLGFTAVCGDDGRVAGIFTDGDLRRLIETGADLRAMRAADVMSASPKLVRADALAVEAADLMERHRVTGLLVVDGGGQLVGAINSNDLMRAKVI